eukprot:TRINITY_DN1211_c0_g2_i1.p1 TRINITY_DN1211_c0_g2~~TRINITY_DN1211_c0_g2_i1.p1  ORF type:complete len:368 (+),score=98.13 TRINITY_DN1211_c0_g2_i1:34-1137(+)
MSEDGLTGKGTNASHTDPVGEPVKVQLGCSTTVFDVCPSDDMKDLLDALDGLQQPSQLAGTAHSSSMSGNRNIKVIDVEPSGDMADLLSALDELEPDQPPIAAAPEKAPEPQIESMCTSLLSALKQRKSETGSDPAHWNPTAYAAEIKEASKQFDTLDLPEILDKFDDLICEASGPTKPSPKLELGGGEKSDETLNSLCRSLMKDLKEHKQRTGSDPWPEVVQSGGCLPVCDDEVPQPSNSELENSLTTMCRSLMKGLKVHKEETGTDPWSGPASPNSNRDNTSSNNNTTTVSMGEIDGAATSDDLSQLLGALDDLVITSSPQQKQQQQQQQQLIAPDNTPLESLVKELGQELSKHGPPPELFEKIV